MSKQTITHESGHAEAWVCLCGNRPDADGFFTCGSDGNEILPTLHSGWAGTYACARCGRIINQDNLEVIGRNPHPTLLN